ncbi:MAG: pyridoxamine 5'-phosphate oxidase [Bacteroidota bacterium]
MPTDPFTLFADWFADAEAHAAIRYPHAMTLATVDAEGMPDARIVLCHAFDTRGFAFMTDARSPKAQHLAARPHAAMMFYWEPLERQVRIQGTVDPGTEAEADAYFAERPRRSRITAWASVQSAPLDDRAGLEDRMAEHDDRFADVEPVARPPHWRTYRVVPERIEFWQAGARRLHHRTRYDLDDTVWTRTLLEP